MKLSNSKRPWRSDLAALHLCSACYLLFWLALCWSIDIQHLVTGVFCVFCLAIGWRQLLPKTILDLKSLLVVLRYMSLLAGEVARANIQVALIVLHPRLPISPAFVRARTPLSTPVGKTVLANSLTLTPGTLTVDVEGDSFLVHTLTDTPALDLTNWRLTRILLDLERRWGF